MSQQHHRPTPTTIGEVYSLLGYILVKGPTFKTALSGQNIESVFRELNEGLKAIRGEVGEDRLAKLTSLSERTRAHFEADPGDSNGETREGRRLIQEMEAIVLSAVKKPDYPEIDRDEMIELAHRLRVEDGSIKELETIADRLMVALPNAEIMGLLFDDRDLPIEEAIDEALRREEAANS